MRAGGHAGAEAQEVKGPLQILDGRIAGARRRCVPGEPGAGAFVLASGTTRPDLAWREWITGDTVLALEFRRHREFLDAMLAKRVAKLGVAKFRRPDTFLLLLDAVAALQGQAQRPFEVFVGNRLVQRWVDEFQQPRGHSPHEFAES
jgi:hypothetical protein